MRAPDAAATARANVNVALVKYWGKRDAALNLPAAGSISVTLDGLGVEASVRFRGGADRFVIDGEEAVVEWTGTDNTYGSRHYVGVARQNGSLATAKAFVLVDMIGDRDLQLTRETHSTPWLDGIIRGAAIAQKLGSHFSGPPLALEDDHLPFLAAGIPSVDIIDFDFPAWHTAGDTLDAVSARSLQIVGDVLLAALPQIEAKLK